MNNWKYPTPAPGQKNANANHGTGADKMRQGHRGTMGRNGNSGAGSGPKRGC